MAEKEKADLQASLVSAHAKAEKKDEELSTAHLQTKATEEAKAKAEEAQKYAKEHRAWGRR